jgi:hypothetical protein
MKNEDIEEYLEQNKNKFVTFKSSMTSKQQEFCHPNQPHVNPKAHLIKPRPGKKESLIV